MVNEDILQGLKSALARGESLKQAMISFYNSGYTKDEIEEAARALKVGQAEQPPPQPAQPQAEKSKTEKATIKEPTAKLKTVQRVSEYEPKKSKGKGLIIILIILLVLLIAALVGVFLFRNTLTNLLNKLL